MEEYLLTTLDNPYDPFTEWDDWLAYDTQMDYNTLAHLARHTYTSDELSEADEALAIDDGMNIVVALNENGKYIKVKRKTN